MTPQTEANWSPLGQARDRMRQPVYYAVADALREALDRGVIDDAQLGILAVGVGRAAQEAANRLVPMAPSPVPDKGRLSCRVCGYTEGEMATPAEIECGIGGHDWTPA